MPIPRPVDRPGLVGEVVTDRRLYNAGDEIKAVVYVRSKATGAVTAPDESELSYEVRARPSSPESPYLRQPIRWLHFTQSDGSISPLSQSDGSSSPSSDLHRTVARATRVHQPIRAPI